MAGNAPLLPQAVVVPRSERRSAGLEFKVAVVLGAVFVALGLTIWWWSRVSPLRSQTEAVSEVVEIVVTGRTTLYWTFADGMLLSSPRRLPRTARCLGWTQLAINPGDQVRLTKLPHRVLVIEMLQQAPGGDARLVPLVEGISARDQTTLAAGASLGIGIPCTPGTAMPVPDYLPLLRLPAGADGTMVAAPVVGAVMLPAPQMSIEGTVTIGGAPVETTALDVVAGDADGDMETAASGFMVEMVQPALRRGEVFLRGESIVGSDQYDADRIALLDGDVLQIGAGKAQAGSEATLVLGTVRAPADTGLQLSVIGRTDAVELTRRGSDPTRLSLTLWQRLTRDPFLQQVWIVLGALGSFLGLWSALLKSIRRIRPGKTGEHV